jgi:hypothetical protein
MRTGQIPLLSSLPSLRYPCSALVAESYTGGTISFEENTAVNAPTWETIEKLKNGEVASPEELL